MISTPEGRPGTPAPGPSEPTPPQSMPHAKAPRAWATVSRALWRWFAHTGLHKDADALQHAIAYGRSEQIIAILDGRQTKSVWVRLLLINLTRPIGARLVQTRAPGLIAAIGDVADVLALTASCADTGDELGWRALLAQIDGHGATRQGEEALIVAIEKQQEALALALLQRSPALAETRHSRTQAGLLACAAMRGMTTLVEQLATVQTAAQLDCDGENALMNALSVRASWLKQEGVDPQRVAQCIRTIAPLSDSTHRSGERKGALSVLLLAARHCEDVQTLLVVLDTTGSRCPPPDASDAIEAAVHTFLSATPILARTVQQENALMILIKRGRLDLLETLLTHCAWPNSLLREAFVCALKNRELECAERLCEAASPAEERLYLPMLEASEMPVWRRQIAMRLAQKERQAIEQALSPNAQNPTAQAHDALLSSNGNRARRL